MADVVYLHVGAPKTGTTYIQDRLALNRTQLARHDVRYPLGARGDMFHAALDLIERPWGGMLPDAKGEWDALVKRTRRAHGSVVISHEILAGATGEQVERAVASLAPAEIHVVLTVRDIARQVPAEWQERLKHQGRMRYGKFVRRIQKPRSEIGRSFWQVQGVTQVLERWSRQLPPERVHVVTVPQPGAPHGELWRRFCRAIDVDPDWAPLDSVRRNPSIGAPESAMLRQLNDRLRRTRLEHADYRTLVRHLIVHETLATEPVQQRITLPPNHYEWADEIFESWREWIVGSGVAVVGDVEDLRPVRPAPDAIWHDPDRTRPRQVADAALDALVAMIEEAARRDDPDEHLSVRVTKAAKRLRER
ncbi:hypothetical protein GCM10023350_34760 [Nocardioides endophyticus]|uniref:Sulfotransferase family protein n=1 Tax=Nocardioides endophyticus TaxID=1353775 RepID=A0ABP8Z5L2_9ACTN